MRNRVDGLEATIRDYLERHNAEPRPFVWSKTAESIIAHKRRARDKLDETKGNTNQALGGKH